MGLLSGIFGNASVADPAKIQEKFSQILTSDEKVEHAFKLIRDAFLFTDRRLILINRQGLTGKKMEYHSLPYSKITHFSVETSGHLDLEADLKIWISGTSEPIRKEFSKKVDIYNVQSVLASYVT